MLFLKRDGTVLAATMISNDDGGLPFAMTGKYFGGAVAAVGDLNEDGITDLAVGASAHWPDGWSTYAPVGAVYIVYLTSTCGETAEPTVSPVPTPAPSANPSPMPTSQPTDAPTQTPTSVPTKTTELIVAPQEVSLEATKPNAATYRPLLIVNPNDDGNLWISLTQSELSQNVSWHVSPDHFFLQPGQFEEVSIEIETTGLRPQEYFLRLLIEATSDISLPVTGTVDITANVNSIAVPNNTRVSIAGRPTLGDAWSGLEVEMRDSDNFPILEESTSQDFIAVILF